MPLDMNSAVQWALGVIIVAFTQLGWPAEGHVKKYIGSLEKGVEGKS